MNLISDSDIMLIVCITHADGLPEGYREAFRACEAKGGVLGDSTGNFMKMEYECITDPKKVQQIKKQEYDQKIKDRIENTIKERKCMLLLGELEPRGPNYSDCVYSSTRILIIIVLGIATICGIIFIIIRMYRKWLKKGKK